MTKKPSVTDFKVLERSFFDQASAIEKGEKTAPPDVLELPNDLGGGDQKRRKIVMVTVGVCGLGLVTLLMVGLFARGDRPKDEAAAPTAAVTTAPVAAPAPAPPLPAPAAVPPPIEVEPEPEPPPVEVVAQPRAVERPPAPEKHAARATPAKAPAPQHVTRPKAPAITTVRVTKPAVQARSPQRPAARRPSSRRLPGPNVLTKDPFE